MTGKCKYFLAIIFIVASLTPSLGVDYGNLLRSGDSPPRERSTSSTCWASATKRNIDALNRYSPKNSDGCVTCDSTCSHDKRKYKWQNLPYVNFTVNEVISIVDASICVGDYKRVGIESLLEEDFLVECLLCNEYSKFGSEQCKTNILTGGRITVTRDVSVNSVLNEASGEWEGWDTGISILDANVVLLSPETGEQSVETVVTPGDYAIILVGNDQLLCKKNLLDKYETYRTWGLMSLDGTARAAQSIPHVVCEMPIDDTTTGSSTSTSTMTSSSTSTITSSSTSTITSSSTSTITSSSTSTITSSSTSTITSSSTSTMTPSSTSTTTSPSTSTMTSSSTSTITPSSTSTTTSSSTSTINSTSTIAQTTPPKTTPSLTTTPRTTTTTLPSGNCCTYNNLTICPGSPVTQSCPEGHVGSISIACINDEIHEVDNCVFSWIDDALTSMMAGNTSADVIASGLRNNTDKQRLSPFDLEVLVGIVANLTFIIENEIEEMIEVEGRRELATSFAENLVALVGNVVEVEETWEDLDPRVAAIHGSSLLSNLEATGFIVAEQYEKYYSTFQDSQINMTVYSTPREEFSGEDLYFPNSSESTFLRLPTGFEALFPAEEKHLKLVAFLLHQDSAALILPGVRNRNLLYKNHKKVNSPLLSMTFVKRSFSTSFTPLADDVTLRFEHAVKESGPTYRNLYRDPRPDEIATPVPGTAKCVYWNHTTSEWDSAGCWLVNTTREVTFCQCNHLTMISIITDIHHHVGRDPVLDVMGTVLMTASCVCLFLAFCIFQFCKNIASPRVAINKQLCVSLGVSHLLLLFLLDRDFLKLSEEGCSIAAVFLHYWVTAGIFWMLAEGGHLFQTVQHVFSRTHYIPAYWMLGYGVPLVVVLVTVLVAYASGSWTSQVAYAPADGDYCWLSTEQGYIWAFTGPLVLVIIVNTICMVLALRSAAILEANKQKTIPQQLKMWVKGCFSLNCILGTTWIFGLLYINQGHFFAYMFTILNGSQGVMIFVLHCLVNDTVRESLLNSLPETIKKHLKRNRRAHQLAMSTSRAQSANHSRRMSLPSLGHNVTTSTSLSTTSASSPTRRMSEPNFSPQMRPPDITITDGSRWMLPGELGQSVTPPLRYQRRLRREEFRCGMCQNGREDLCTARCNERQGSPPNPSPPRRYRSNRSGSQWSNATQITFMSDGPGDGSSGTRRTSFESYVSSASDESSESYGSDFPGNSASNQHPTGSSGTFLAPLELPLGQEDLRFTPEFDTIIECDERSPRSENISFFYD